MAPKNGYGPAEGYLPAGPVAVLIRRHLKEATELRGNIEGAEGPAPLDNLSERSGVGQRTIWRYLTGESRSIRFDNADRILCALDSAYLWYCEPLSGYYEKVRLAG